MSTNVRFYLSYDIKNTLKSHFWRKKRYNAVNMYAMLWTSLKRFSGLPCISLCETWYPERHNLTKLGRSLLGDATY